MFGGFACALARSRETDRQTDRQRHRGGQKEGVVDVKRDRLMKMGNGGGGREKR